MPRFDVAKYILANYHSEVNSTGLPFLWSVSPIILVINARRLNNYYSEQFIIQAFKHADGREVTTVMHPMNRLMEMKILSNINRVVQILIELSRQDESKKRPLFEEAVSLLQEIHPLLLRLVDGREALLESLIRQLISQKLPHPSVLRSFGTLQHDLTVIISWALGGIQTSPIGQELPYTEAETALMAGSSTAPVTEDLAPDPAEADVPMNAAVDRCDASLEPPAEDTGERPAPQVVTEPPGEQDPHPADAVLSAPPVQEQADPDALLPRQEIQDAQEQKYADNLAGLINSMYANETIIRGFIFYGLSFDYYLPERKTAIVVESQKRTKNGIHDYLLRKNEISLVKIEPEEINNLLALSQKLPRFG